MPLPEDQFYNFTVVYDYDNFTVVTGYVLLSEYKHKIIYMLKCNCFNKVPMIFKGYKTDKIKMDKLVCCWNMLKAV